MTEPRSLVANAADRQQVEEAAKKEKRGRVFEANDLIGLLELPTFRRFAWRLLDRASTMSSVISSTPEMTYYNAGKQDYGHWLIEELERAKSGAYLEIIKQHQQELGDA